MTSQGAAGPELTTSYPHKRPPEQHNKVRSISEEVEPADATLPVCCWPETLPQQQQPPQYQSARQDADAGGGGCRRNNVPANMPEGSAAPGLEWAGVGVAVITAVAALWLVFKLYKSLTIK